MKKLYSPSLSSVLLLSAGILVSTSPLHAKKNRSITAPVALATELSEQNSDLTSIDGIKYKTLQEAPADAKKAIKSQSVCVHYTGWLNINGQKGKKFDSSVDRNQPFNFHLGVGEVIAGWDKIVAQMRVGQKVIVYIPAALAYGTKGHGSAIPKSSDLIFEIEFLKIN